MRYAAIILLAIFGHLFFLYGCNEEPVNVPFIYSFSPLTGRIDTVITILGTNFSDEPTKNIVKINGVICPLISSSADKIIIRAVPGVSTGKISVTVGNLAAISFNDFILKPHTITSMTPAEGAIGDEVSITGSNYGNSINDVRLLFYDSVPAAIYDYHSVNDTIKTFKTKVPETALTGQITIWIDSLVTKSETEFIVTP